MIPATQLRVGMNIKRKGELCRVVKVFHLTPGKGRGMIQAKMVNLIKGTNVEYRFRSDEDVEVVRLDQKEMEYIYNDGDNYYFMDTVTFEQLPISRNFLEESIDYLIPNIKCEVEFYEEKPIGITLPKTVDMIIKETEPKFKGATAASSMKPAVTETGLIVQVPPFVETGDKVRIDTAENKYIERIK